MTDKFLINCQHGGNDLEKATVAMIVAGAARTIGYINDGAKVIM